MKILDAMRDPALFGPWFAGRATWQSWEVFLMSLFGLPFTDPSMLAIFEKHTGRKLPSSTAAREAWVVVGRRGGKSQVAALVAVYPACFRDYRPYLAPGEVGTLPVIAADRRQVRTVMRYICGLFEGIPMLAEMVQNQTRDAIELKNRVTIEVHTANFRAVRGYSLVGAVCDEIAFWRTDDGSATPDAEILAPLRPGMATIPSAMLIAISSPYARRGVLWDNYTRHFGRDGDPVLVWQGDTKSMNPAVDPRVIEEAYEQDEAAAAAEYGAEFRRDVDSFIGREVVDAAIVPGRFELPPGASVEYRAFVDPSGGSQDSMTLAIAHREGERAVIDVVRERRPPFNPSEVVAEFAALLRSYGVTSVSGDRYAGEWPREQFRKHGISYRTADSTKSEFYLSLLPRLNAGTVELLDDRRLANQLCGLERRTSRAGKDSVDHGPGGHDDLVNAVAGAVAQVTVPLGWTVAEWDEPDEPCGDGRRPNYTDQLKAMAPFLFEADDGLTCGHCLFFEADGDRSRCSLRKLIIPPQDFACPELLVAAA